MSPEFPFTDRESPIVMALLLALQKTLDIHEALSAAYPLLCKLVPADHGSMCISRTHDLYTYDWSVVALPERFFCSYREIAKYDFVRDAVGRQPNVVICDEAMLPPDERKHLDRNPMVVYARENEMDIKQIMAVMIAKQPTWNGGLTLYRDRAMAFSPREQAMLQTLLPYFEATMANCKRFEGAVSWSQLLEDSFKLYGTSIVLFSPSLRLIQTTEGIEGVVRRCFVGETLGEYGLPQNLLDKLKLLASKPGLVPPSTEWIPAHPGAGVVVTFEPLLREGRVFWKVSLDEIPRHWRNRLSRAEIDVALYAAQGRDNAYIAKTLGIKQPTVKGHLGRAFKELGIDGREMLIAQFRARR